MRRKAVMDTLATKGLFVATDQLIAYVLVAHPWRREQHCAMLMLPLL
jgi:hypothetical protein